MKSLPFIALALSISVQASAHAAMEFSCKGMYQQVELNKNLKFTAKKIQLRDRAGTIDFDRKNSKVNDDSITFTVEKIAYYGERLSLIFPVKVMESTDETKKFSMIMSYAETVEGAKVSGYDVKMKCVALSE